MSLESIVQDQVLEAQSIGVTACQFPIRKKYFWSMREYTAIFVSIGRDVQNPFKILIGLFSRQNHGAGRNIQWIVGRTGIELRIDWSFRESLQYVSLICTSQIRTNQTRSFQLVGR